MFSPIEASESIKQTYIDYITTSFPIADAHYRNILRDALASYGSVAKGPYLDVSGSFKTAKSVSELVSDGSISKLFLTLESKQEKEKELKISRPLYSHQQSAFLKANAGANLVITTGTGSGKTECFLLPILQALLAEKEAGTLDRSVRAIIIYPMNALANDQIKRIRNILATFSDITFGLYNSNTRHDQSKAIADYRSLHKEEAFPIPLPNEVISREMMQKTPPHILITNYSMLEYMMLRPKDDAIFSGANLRFIVLDEAHIYRGATGMETALLVRRLRARISNPESVQFILTSATLGGKDADDDITKFAQNLCGVQFVSDSIIRSETIHQPMIEFHDFPPELFEELCDGIRTTTEILRAYQADFAPNGDDNEKLYELMLRYSHFSQFRAETEVPQTVGMIARKLGVASKELINLIDVSGRAMKEGTSLVNSRYHFFIRALEGAYISLTGKRELHLVRKEFDTDLNPVFECAICTDCGRLAILGVMEGTTLRQPNNRFDRKIDYFLLKRTGDSEYYEYNESDDKSSSDEADSTDIYDYLICPECGIIEMESVARQTHACEHKIESYIKLRKARKRSNGEGEAACPACEFGGFRSFYLGYEAATSVLGTALFESLPDIEYVPAVPNRTNETSIFGIVNEDQSIGREKTRQFLAFSDSRADAAFFASYMEMSYQEFLRRRGIWQICDKQLDIGQHSITTRDVIRSLISTFEDNGTFVKIGQERESWTET